MDSQESTSTENAVEGTTEISREIKQIDKISVHKICSGQVILGLGSAVKELVENSLDAGSTLVEVKLKDQGLESVEVSDNGVGVEKTNFKALTAKYHTSKIQDFTDLGQVTTFGFRGEALSSLCALADVVITTKHKSASCGTRLVFDVHGDITQETPCARQVGTTVQLSNLFGTLPVRKAEFRRNINKEFTKMCNILQSYCLSATGVRIICTNITPQGRKTTIFHTDGGKEVLDNIRNIFDAQQVADLVKIKPALEMGSQYSQEMFQDLDLGDVRTEDLEKLNLMQFNITGWISTCAHGSGRKSRDRQFIYINSRPCEPKKISKVINDVYRKYNNQQYPFVFLDIHMDYSKVDVNVTPDKRQLFVGNENILLLALRISLLRTFNECASNYKIEQPPSEKSVKMITSYVERKKDPEILISSQEKFSEKLSQWRATGSTEDVEWKKGKNIKRKIDDEITARTVKMQKIQRILGSPEKIPIKARISCGSTPKREIAFETAATPAPAPKSTEILEEIEKVPKIVEDEIVIDVDSVVNSYSSRAKIRRMVQKLSISLDDIRTRSQKESEVRKKASEEKSNFTRLKFKAKLDANITEVAEEELSREISKASFAQMKVIGQFNLSFIIARLDDDLFIVDQHATDEKYNFEQLQTTEKIQSQPLVVPQNLELSAVKELQLMDNLDVFQRNGFHFSIDHSAEMTKRVKLVQKPQCRNWDFGLDDIEELLFMLQDAPPGLLCRPSRVRAMFASRACRMSVMFGKALKKTDMKKLLQHMGEIKHPWHCPHGRPTMRHLINLTMISD